MRSLLFLVSMLSLLLVACSDAPNAAQPTGSAGSSTAGGGGSTTTDIPCDVDEVLANNCRGCHAAPPRYGAPMPLASVADLHAPAVSDPTRSVLTLVQQRLADPQSPMPPTGDMPAEDRAILDAWLDAGAPANQGPPCGTEPPVPPPPIGVDALPCEPTHSFTAHAQGSAAPYHVPEVGAGNLYQCFTFRSPFNGTTQATAWAPIIDDERVLHHWILYRTKTPQTDGGVMPCNMPQDSVFVAGWAPGGSNFVLPDEVGLELAGQDDWFILQVHYHNAVQHADALDTSGVALCTTDTPRQHLAGVYTLGSVLINIPPFANGYQTVGQCPGWLSGFLPEPLHLIASFPHMHELGRSIRTEILRGGDNGPPETLVDVEPWSFEDQRFYPHDPAVQLDPGDAVRTTCTYDNPTSATVTMGERTEDEMCFNFVMLYPISILGEGRSCGLFGGP